MNWRLASALPALALTTCLALCLSGCGDAPAPSTQTASSADIAAWIEQLEIGSAAERFSVAAQLAGAGPLARDALRERLLRPMAREPGVSRPTEKRPLDAHHFAAQALGMMGTDGIPALLDVLEGDEELPRVEAQHVLTGLSLNPEQVHRLAGMLRSPKVMVAARAGELLRTQEAGPFVAGLRSAYTDERELMRLRVLGAIEAREDDAGQELLLEAAGEPDHDVRIRAWRILGDRIAAKRVDADRVAPMLDLLRKETRPEVASWIARALQAFEAPIDTALAEALSDALGQQNASPSALTWYLPGVLAARARPESYASVVAALRLAGSKGDALTQLRAAHARVVLEASRAKVGAPPPTDASIAELREFASDRLLAAAGSREAVPHREEAITLLRSFPERAADVARALRVALDVGSPEEQCAAIVTADGLLDAARASLRDAVAALKDHEDQRVQDHVRVWWGRHGERGAEVPK